MCGPPPANGNITTPTGVWQVWWSVLSCLVPVMCMWWEGCGAGRQRCLSACPFSEACQILQKERMDERERKRSEILRMDERGEE